VIPQNLLDYVKVYKDHVPAEVCKSALQNLKDAEWRLHQYYLSGTASMVSYETDLSISYENIPEREIITERIWFAIEQYILKDFASFDEWFNGWDGYTPVRFNKYDPKTEMKLHCDHIHSMFDGNRKGVPILTVLGALNDDYEGGELLMFGDYRIHLPAGSVMVFPSNFMFPHEVKPVKSGVRYSYVSWTW
jgi:hypothetical protein